MGFLDKLRGLFKGRAPQVKSGIDKAADVADDKTGGKHTEKIDDAAQKAKGVVDKVAGEDAPGDTTTPTP